MLCGLAQINPRVGDLEGNLRKIEERLLEAVDAGASLVVFPELALCGYPPRDLLDDPDFWRRNDAALAALETLSKRVPATFVVGHVERSESAYGKAARNCATAYAGGKILARYRKQLLPFYDVFEEERYFEPGSEPASFEVEGKRFALTICEDVWNHGKFLERPYARTPDLLPKQPIAAVLNLSASPFRLGKPALRAEVMAAFARRAAAPVLHVNQVGANDELIFDGGSLALAADGRVLARGPVFREAILLCDVGQRGTVEPWPETEEAWLWDALVLGLRDYCGKSGVSKVVLGISGGIDSAVVAAIAVDALGKEGVLGVRLPTRFTSDASQEDAAALAQNLGVALDTVAIEPAFEAFLALWQSALGRDPQGTTKENFQPRIRMTVLMGLANEQGRLLLHTGNKSEIATGYSTLYGDGAGALAVIGDVTKGQVYALARARNLRDKTPLIPLRILERAPTAELRENQTDQDSLPPYDAVDACVRRYVEHQQGETIDPAAAARFVGLYEGSEFKRRQLPPVLRVSCKAFGMGRRIPVAAKRFVSPT